MHEKNYNFNDLHRIRASKYLLLRKLTAYNSTEITVGIFSVFKFTYQQMNTVLSFSPVKIFMTKFFALWGDITVFQ